MFVADFLGVSNLMDAEADRTRPTPSTAPSRVGDFRLRARRGDLDASGPVKIVARPERVKLLDARRPTSDNCLPGMVERTVYVGATLQVMVRLATGAQLQASITNTGDADSYQQGTPVSVHIPADALRVPRQHRGCAGCRVNGGGPASAPATDAEEATASAQA